MTRHVVAALAVFAIVSPADAQADRSGSKGNPRIGRAPEAIFRLPKDRDIFFKSYSYTASEYVQFRANGSYRRIGREHMFVEEIDRGTWTQADSGEITLVSQKHRYETDPEANPFHITPMTYKGVTFLLWKDSETPVHRDLAEIMRSIDKRERNQVIGYIYQMIDRKTFEDESGRTQEFLFYPEMNPPRPHK